MILETMRRDGHARRIDAPEDKHGSLKGQQKELADYAEQMGFEVVGVSQDTGSGLNFARNGLAEIIEAGESYGRIAAVLEKAG